MFKALAISLGRAGVALAIRVKAIDDSFPDDSTFANDAAKPTAASSPLPDSTANDENALDKF